MRYSEFGRLFTAYKSFIISTRKNNLIKSEDIYHLSIKGQFYQYDEKTEFAGLSFEDIQYNKNDRVSWNINKEKEVSKPWSEKRKGFSRRDEIYNSE